MKKALKIILVLLLVILTALIVLPFAFKGKIVEAVKNEAGKSLNARLDFQDVSLSLLRNFPNLSVGITEFSITGIEAFSNDTLAYIPALRVVVNLKSVLKGDTYEIRSARLDEPAFLLKVLADGSENWDIVKPSADTTIAEPVPSQFRADLQKLIIRNGKLTYDDASLPMWLRFAKVDVELSGDLTADYTELKAQAESGSVTADYDGIRYLSNAKATLVSSIGADLSAWKFSFPDAKLTVNELEALASGYFSMPDEGYDMDIHFEALKNDFKSFLSLIPAVYAKDFDNLQAEGSMAFTGYVKGLYSEVTFPAFGVDLGIENAGFRYPELPQAVENVMVKAVIDNKTGDMDATVIDIRKFHMEMAGNPIDIKLFASTPISDPYVDASAKGVLNLSDIGKFYPLDENTSMSGILDADVTAKGKLSVLEAGKYEQFEADGRFVVSGVNLKNPSFPDGLKVHEARIDLSPSVARMPVMKAEVGRNDFDASGKIENMLAYFFGKGDLKGELNLKSSYLNLNDFLSAESNPDTKASDSVPLEVIPIPKGIDFTATALLDHVIYDNMDLHNVNGKLRVKDQQLTLDNILFNTLEGSIGINGFYSTAHPEKPVVDFRLDIKNVDVRQAFNTFNTMEILAPIAGLAEGKISTILNLKTDLNGNMMPVYSSINGSGRMLSDALTISNVNSFNKLADALKIERFRQWVIEKINLSFELVDGKVFVKPFETRLGSTIAEISGWNAFDQTMEYVMQLNIPRSEFGGAANNVLNNLVNEANKKGANFSVGDRIPVAVLIKGTVTNPVITTSLRSAAGNVLDDMKQQINETIQQKKDEAVTKVREEALKYLEEANARAARLLADAQKQADEVVRLASDAASRLRAEADKQAENLIAEGKKKGPVAELAARKAAEKVRQEASERADRIVAEANTQSAAIMTKANQESDRIIQDARVKAEGGQN
ncbi:MAG TPA: AsmA-like C-terminal region-containing protein [Lentimicrobium sp.]|nr:AsmA-like C-terminal region-containing protein [Lentimicrobium sp.]